MLNIKVILGSTKDQRFGEVVFNFVKVQLGIFQNINIEYIDIKDLNLPFFREAVSPKKEVSKNPNVLKWAKKVKEADGFLIITPEYNHGYPAELKNALDFLYDDWNKKPVGFVSYGTVGGARAVEQLRAVAIELQMAPIREGLHFLKHWELFDTNGTLKKGFLEEYQTKFYNLFEQLVWWSVTLKEGRNMSRLPDGMLAKLAAHS